MEVNVADHSRVAAGAAGERRAALEYRRLGFKTVDRNWRCAGAEIDLIVCHDDLIVFVEVKTRRRRGFSDALSAVDGSKQERIRLGAQRWLMDHPEHAGDRVRFDAVAVVAGTVEIVEGAF